MKAGDHIRSYDFEPIPDRGEFAGPQGHHVP
jgi:hypothetical protein